MGPILAAIRSNALVTVVGALLFQFAPDTGAYPIALACVDSTGGGALFRSVMLDGIPSAVDVYVTWPSNVNVPTTAQPTN